MSWIYRYPFLVLLLPLIAVIVLCHYTGHPFDLDRETNVTIDTTYQRYRVVITSYPVERPKTFRYEAFCPLPHALTLQPMPVSIYLYLPKDSLQPAFGDTLIISARLRVPEPQGSFDYAHYLRTRGIVATAFTRRYDTGSKTPTTRATHYDTLRYDNDNHSPLGLSPFASRLSPHRLTAIQHRLVERYRFLGVHGPELGTIAALTLGYRESLEPDIRQAFQTAGAMHVLAVSGLHTGILMSVLLWLMTGLGLYPPLWEEQGRRISLAISMIILLWCYAGITGWTPSVVRSVVMCSIAMIGYMCHRTPVSINTVAAAAFLILLFRPNDLFSISFQLSFAAVLGILLLAPLFSLRDDNVCPKGYVGDEAMRRLGDRDNQSPLTDNQSPLLSETSDNVALSSQSLNSVTTFFSSLFSRGQRLGRSGNKLEIECRSGLQETSDNVALSSQCLNSVTTVAPAGQRGTGSALGKRGVVEELQTNDAEHKVSKKRQNKLTRYLRDCITVSLSAQLATAPFTIYYFGTFSTYFLLTNIVILPMAWLLMVVSLLTLTIGWIPAVGPVLGQVLYWLTYALNHYVMWIESLPASQLTI